METDQKITETNILPSEPDGGLNRKKVMISCVVTGIEHSLSEWCKILNLSYNAVYQRYRNNRPFNSHLPKLETNRTGRPSSILIEAYGVRLSLGQWCRETGQPYGRLYQRYFMSQVKNRSPEDWIIPVNAKAAEFYAKFTPTKKV